jgi:hypothetical protein
VPWLRNNRPPSEIKIAQRGYWSERRQATAVGNPDAAGRLRRRAWPFGMKSVKLYAIYGAGIVLGLLTFAYTAFAPEESPTVGLVLASPETANTARFEAIRRNLFYFALAAGLAAFLMMFIKPRAASFLWGLVLAVALAIAMVPSSAPAFPFATLVFWIGMGIQVVLCYLSFSVLKSDRAGPRMPKAAHLQNEKL